MENNVYILGAGFSAPAGIPVVSNFIPSAKKIFTDNANELKSPNFYEHFEKVFLYKKQIEKDVNSTFLNDFDDIEKFYSYIDFESRYIDNSPGKSSLRRSLILMIAKTIEFFALKDLKTYSLPDSPLKNRLKRANRRIRHDLTIYDLFVLLMTGELEMKQLNSTVITFNYDVVLDSSIFTQGYTPNYCLPGSKIEGIGENFKILKLHGSLNWLTCANPDCKQYEEVTNVEVAGQYLNELIYGKCPTCHRRQLTPLIIPPSWDKSQFRNVFNYIWKEAGKQ